MADYPAKNWRIIRWVWMIVGVVLILISSISVLILISRTIELVIIFGRGIILKQLPPIFLFLCLVFPAGVLTLLLSGRRWSQGVTIYNAGMVLYWGNRYQPWVWNDIERYDNHIIDIKFGSTIIDQRIKVVLEDQYGKKCTIRNQYDCMEELIKNIRTLLLPILFVKFENRLNQGESIIFNKNITATKTGLNVRMKTYQWSEISKPQIKNGIVELKEKLSRTTFLKSRINQIKNYDLLIHLIEKPPL